MSYQNEMEKIVTLMMEHLCDHLCRFPWETERKEDLEEICAECKMRRYVCDILNTYSRVNDFQNTQCANLLKELAKEQEKRRWIPVEEQLPTTEDGYAYVMVSMDDEFVCTTAYTDKDGFEFSAESWEVIAWMALPEPFIPQN